MARNPQRNHRRTFRERASGLVRRMIRNQRDIARLTNSCSNLENAVDTKKEEIRILELHANVTEDFMSKELMTANSFKKASYELLRPQVQRPRKALTRAQRSALTRIYGAGANPPNQASPNWGLNELEQWYLAKYPMCTPGPPPIHQWQEPPSVDETFADFIEEPIGQLQEPTQLALKAAYNQYKQAIEQAYLAGEGRAPTPVEARVLASGMPVFHRSFPYLEIGS